MGELNQWVEGLPFTGIITFPIYTNAINLVLA